MNRYVDYDCGCWFIFDDQDPHNWKLVDFVICDEHVSLSSTTSNDPTIPDTEAHVVILPTKEMKEKYPRSR